MKGRVISFDIVLRKKIRTENRRYLYPKIIPNTAVDESFQQLTENILNYGQIKRKLKVYKERIYDVKIKFLQN